MLHGYQNDAHSLGYLLFQIVWTFKKLIGGLFLVRIIQCQKRGVLGGTMMPSCCGDWPWTDDVRS
jgi:hypothetical protein